MNCIGKVFIPIAVCRRCGCTILYQNHLSGQVVPRKQKKDTEVAVLYRALVLCLGYKNLQQVLPTSYYRTVRKSFIVSNMNNASFCCVHSERKRQGERRILGRKLQRVSNLRPLPPISIKDSWPQIR